MHRRARPSPGVTDPQNFLMSSPQLFCTASVAASKRSLTGVCAKACEDHATQPRADAIRINCCNLDMPRLLVRFLSAKMRLSERGGNRHKPAELPGRYLKPLFVRGRACVSIAGLALERSGWLASLSTARSKYQGKY